MVVAGFGGHVCRSNFLVLLKTVRVSLDTCL